MVRPCPLTSICCMTWLTRFVCRFTSASDVWSFAITAIEIFQDGAEPYQGACKPETKVCLSYCKVYCQARVPGVAFDNCTTACSAVMECSVSTHSVITSQTCNTHRDVQPAGHGEGFRRERAVSLPLITRTMSTAHLRASGYVPAQRPSEAPRL